MLNYYKKIIPAFSYSYYTAMMILSAVFSPVFIKKNIFTGMIMLMFFSFISCIIGIILISPSGPIPSDRKYTEGLNQIRSKRGGAGGNYDMNCIIPVKRKNCAKYALIIFAAMMLINYVTGNLQETVRKFADTL